MQGAEKRDTNAIYVEQKLRDISEAEDKPIDLCCAPIKKAKLKVMLEKATELGVSDLRPIMTQNTNAFYEDPTAYERLLTESAEQCERMSIPKLHPAISLNSLLQNTGSSTLLPAALLLVCRERSTDCPSLLDVLIQQKEKALSADQDRYATGDTGMK